MPTALVWYNAAIMDHWWAEKRWLRRHTMAAPFGIFAATMLLTLSREQWRWPGPAGWDRAGELVDLGAVFYGMAAVAVERSIRFMFWAWEQHQKVREQLREEGRQEVRQESAAQIQELQADIRQLQARLSELEPRRNGARRERRARRRLVV